VSSSPNARALSSRILQKQRELVMLNPVDSSHVMEKLWQLSQLIWNEHHCSISINERYSFRDRSPNRQKTYLALPMWSCELIELLFHTDAVSSRTPSARGTTNFSLNEGFLPPSAMPTKEPSHIMNFLSPCGWLDL
jgi:hypothetical protein